MEGSTIYEDSYKEIVSIRKSLGSSTITINTDKLDGETKSALITAISNVLTTRQPLVFSVLSNIN